MPGIDFDRQVFVPAAADQAPRPLSRILIPLVLVVVIGLIGLIGYKLYLGFSGGVASANSQGIEQMQQQLTDMETRLDQLEKHRKAAVSQPVASAKIPASPIAEPPAPKRTAYKVSAASVLQAQRTPVSTATSVATPASQASGASSATNAINEAVVANHEAWQATTDRLADVVDVVGSQQSELSRTRDDVNKLLAQTRRTAMQFELRRGASREPVGPVSLLLRSSDPKNQRYTVCVYLADQCIELKNRAVDEVVVFVVSDNSAPLELVATKVLRDQIVGYLEVPSSKPTP